MISMYLARYVFIVMKSYQTFDYVNSSVVTKVKGVLSYNNSGVRNIWDSTDFVVPAQVMELTGRGIVRTTSKGNTVRSV